MTSFVFVTGNANKLKEVQAILASGASGVSVTSQAVDVPEIQGTTQEVAIAKVKAAAEKLGTACVTEDTALCFDALNGLPGPYIKDFLGNLGHEGLNNLLKGFNTTRAHALCTFAYSPGPGQEPILFEGRTEGNIVPARGPTHFGWDPIFQPIELGGQKTYAEMDGEEKNKISHRYRALEKLRVYLQDKAKEGN
ncbi:inosine triphosphate pyrophosphatase [Kwoniella mangroviensis CBS 8507]|uniref:inosine triphosphate pyrophosphatase n=1 Tax=Kwoniella mangroviensis CBS 8507 TaxID=1296122 RepID=UPI00080CC9D3|nr:inosine triphosphate pyrophosphatase [Kwoniella mangroviensis CBS 8507]OCF64672.1 inosine triphosphate pyrophosphatase [Kwoniella mangroviensis CBS 8507]